ncbi:MAG TPA: 1-acyl-sn-glycerol-3-phosphate acyltransferase [Alphaproteobacteria bacterium]|nr:1-acyl-sn-glycerol-3-phosphate acyltransferase [Alphaproteobacteria bacterium]
MERIRDWAFSLLFPLMTGIYCILLIFGPLLPRKSTLEVAFVWLRSVAWLERNVLGLDYRVIGRDNLPKHGSFIVAAKHQSTYETMKFHPLLGDPAIVMKRELMRLPIWGWFARRAGMIPIDRSAGRFAIEEMLAAARAAIAEERPIVIFPQGTRVAAGHRRRYKMGAAVLYAELGLPIVPMALDSGLFWPKHGRKRGGTVTFSFLQPIAPGLSQEQALAILEQRLEAETDRLLALHGVETSGAVAA